jgi:hypothetical protein
LDLEDLAFGEVDSLRDGKAERAGGFEDIGFVDDGEVLGSSLVEL